jgi:copper transport protein
MPMSPAEPARHRRILAGAATALVVALAATAGLVATAIPAVAHAVVVSTSPSDGERLEAPPEVFRVEFNEAVSTDLGGLRVFDEAGDRVDEGAVRRDGATVEVGLRDDLDEGAYVATWRVMSGDGHPVRGAIVFSVGDADPDAARSVAGTVSDGGSDRAWRAVGAGGRWLAYSGVLVAAGGAAFLVLVHRGGPDRPALLRWVVAAAALGAVGILVALPVQAALATGQGPGSLFQEGVARGVLGEGIGAATSVGLLGIAAILVGVLRSGPLALVGALVAAGSFAATGHNRSNDLEALATGVGILHLWAAAAWLGGLVLLWRTLRVRRGIDGIEPSATAAIVGRFSTTATGALLAVAAAGLVLAWTEVRSLDALVSTDYGALLFAKVGVVALVLAIAVYNNRVLLPALAGGRHRAATARLRRTLGIEAGALAVVVGITAVLVQVTPARVSAETAVVVERIIELGDAGSVQVVVDPARTGPIEIHLYTYDADGLPGDIAEAMTLELIEPTAGLGPLQREPYRAGPAHFQLDGAAFPSPGTWQLTVRARLDRFTEASATAEIPIGGADGG